MWNPSFKPDGDTIEVRVPGITALVVCGENRGRYRLTLERFQRPVCLRFAAGKRAISAPSAMERTPNSIKRRIALAGSYDDRTLRRSPDVAWIAGKSKSLDDRTSDRGVTCFGRGTPAHHVNAVIEDDGTGEVARRRH